MPTEISESITPIEAHRRGMRYLIAIGAASVVSIGIDVLELIHQVPLEKVGASVVGEVVAVTGLAIAVNHRNNQNLEAANKD